jgi:hypothetical protein
MLLTAALGEGGDAREFLKGRGVSESVALFAESGEKPGGEDRSRARKPGEKLIIRERLIAGCYF